MTNNPTIDGVSRRMLTALLCHVSELENRALVDELRALLDAPAVEPANDLREHCKQCAEVVKTWPEWKRDCLGSAPAVERQEPAMNIPEECPHLIVFDDADRGNLMFSGAGAREAAMKTWEQISMSWNAHLFVRVERNSRDDRYPSATATALQTTIARLEARVAELESGRGKPVAWQYRVSAGPATGWSLWHDGKGDEFRNSYQVENRPLFTAQPAPVAVVLPELESAFEKWWEEDGQYCRAGGGSYEKTFAYRAYEACLDATAALNEPAK